MLPTPQIQNFLRPIALLIGLGLSNPAVAGPVISEFLADNQSGLADEDGAFSDWIEIHNPDRGPINLGGWFLTDDAGDLQKWPIPAVTVHPGGIVVIFASSKDRRAPASELHTNFALSRNGEYLALVQPDGVTVEQEFAPSYPIQDPNRSYGIAFDGNQLISNGQSGEFYVPSSDVGVTWHNPETSLWLGWFVGQNGAGYGIQVPGLTIRDVHSTVPLNSLSDALAALGGANVLSEVSEIHQTINFFDSGGEGHFPDANLVFPGHGGDDFTSQATGTIIVPSTGDWTFGLNSGDGGQVKIDGTPVIIDDSLHGPEDHFGTIFLTAGAHSLDAMFFERTGGAEMEVFAAPGTLNSFGSEFQLVGDTANGGLPVYTTPNGTNGGVGIVSTDLEGRMKGRNSSAYFRFPFSVDDVNSIEALSLEMRYNDGFAAFLNGTLVASDNVPPTLSWNSASTTERDPTEALTVKSFNITDHIGLLVDGPDNLLAIHGVNNSANDDAFLILPELKNGGLSSSDLFYFDAPTPGLINSEPSSLGKVADTKFEPNRGFFYAPIQVAITSATPDTTIRYTTNGSPPTVNVGTVYTGPIAINRTTTLRAAAFKTGYDPTDVDTHTYLFPDDIITQSTAAPPGWPSGSVNSQVYSYGMNQSVVTNGNSAIGGVQETKDALVSIPTLSIVLEQSDLTGASRGIYSNPRSDGFAWERKASVELIQPPGWVDPDGNTEGFASPCGLRIRGGFSRRTQNPKHSFRLFFRSEYGNGRLNYKLFGNEGAAEFDKIDLRGPQNYSWAMGGGNQNSFIRDTWSRDLQGEMGQPYKRSRWYHLYLNGIYWGMCETDERAEANYAETYFGGDQLDYDVVKSFGNVTDGNRNSYQRLWQKWQSGFSSNAAFFDVQGKDPAGNPDSSREKLIDLENLIDYMIITYYTGDRDGPGSRYTQPRPNNYFGIYNRNNPDGYKFFEHDSEHSLGTGENNMVTPFTSSSSLDQFNPHTLHEAMAAQNLEYRMAFADRVAMYCYNRGPLSDAAGVERVNRRADFIDQAIIAHSARWGNSSGRSRLNWLNAVQGVRNFITGRVPTMIGQLRSVGWYPDLDPPIFSQHGGFFESATQLLIEGGPGQIYYTLNGDDPRVLGGPINPASQQFQSNTSTQALISTGANWKYLDDGSNQMTAWRNPGFNDDSWDSGDAQLGYGDGGEATTLEYGPNALDKYITTYFRMTFNVTGAEDFTGLLLELLRDDGAVVYLNGTEQVRPNMPGGTITHLTPAENVVSQNAESIFYPYNLDPSKLVEGSNTIAVEIHQENGGSSDISFDLRLTGTITTTPNPLLFQTPGLNVVKARVRSGGEWSALTEASFLVDTDPASPANLIISEIHYHPASPTTEELLAGYNERSNFEFIELMNTGSRSIDLAGLRFSLGITFEVDESNPFRVVAPGARILLVNNRDAFGLRYGPGLPVAGEFSGNLSNDGEPLTLLDPVENPLIDFVFNDAPAWPGGTDGEGHSLVLINPGAPNDPASWRSSAAIHGNPGSSDATSYPVWKSDHNVTDDDSDDDNDSLSAFVEYVYGGEIGADSHHLAPSASIETIDVGGVEDDYLVLRMTRRIGADDVLLIAEHSADLIAWFSDMVYLGSVNNGDGTENLQFRTADSIVPGDSLFTRVRMSLQP